MRKRIGFFCMGIGAALLLAAFGLLCYNHLEDETAGSSAEEILSAMISAMEESPSAEDDGQRTDMTVLEIDGEQYVGYLSIPLLGIELPVMSEWSDEKLKTAPCRYFGSTKTDNLVICGHNYNRHFGTLKNLQEGDPLFFTDMDGVTISYHVAQLEVLMPTQITEMIESDYALTLYTCTYGGQSRITVRCNRD